MPVSNTGSSPDSVPRENFLFVMNVERLDGGAVHTLAPGYTLRQAANDEISEIRATILEPLNAVHPMLMGLWDHSWPRRVSITPLPEPEWRFFVVAFHGNNATVEVLRCACDLAPQELEVGPVFMFLRLADHTALGRLCDWGRVYHVLEEAELNDGFFIRPSERDIAAVGQIYSMLLGIGSEFEEIKSAAKRVGQLKAFPRRSPLRFLGYFAILESLLTHKPKPTDPYESITRQVRTKLALLDHRWPNRLDYSAFESDEPETVWKKMYSYRSCLAHGDAATFSGDLKVLRDHEAALGLLKDAVKATLRFALEEPRLLMDLRHC